MGKARKLDIAMHGADAHLRVDDRPLTGVVGYTLHHEHVGILPSLTAELLFEEAIVNGEQVIVDVPAPTRAALIALGWTPPPEEDRP